MSQLRRVYSILAFFLLPTGLVLIGFHFSNTFQYIDASTTNSHEDIGILVDTLAAKEDIRVCPEEIQFGETIQCSITSPAEADTYSFMAKVGDHILVRMTSPGELWSGIRIHGPEGEMVTNCTAWHSTMAEVIDCQLPSDGSYLIIVYDGYNSTYTGEYYLYLQRISEPGNTTSIAFGQTISGTIFTPAQMDTYTFIAKSGDKVVVRMTSPGNLWSGIRVHDTDGKVVNSCTAWHSTMAEVKECSLPADGEYVLMIYDGYSGLYTGDYHIYVQRLNLSGAPLAIAYNSTLSGTIDTPAQMNTYLFPAKSNDRVQIKMTSPGELWSGIRVHGPDGIEISGCTAWHSTTAEIPNCQLPSTGNYQILVYDGYSGLYTGGYSLSLTCLTPPCHKPITTTQAPLVLLYAVLDNNLGDDPETWERLVNNAEAGIHAGVNVRLMIDGPGTEDAYVYDLQPDTNPHCPRLGNHTCGGRYSAANNNFKTWDENTAHPYSLRDFVTETITSHAGASPIILALIGHGSGWSANALPHQPSAWKKQPSDVEDYKDKIGGLLWDDQPGDGGTSRSLSTKALGFALAEIKRVTGRSIDLLYLDACSMGMTEVAYEVRDSVAYLLASPNTDWASFAYNEMLKEVNSKRPILDIGKAWLAAEANVLQRDEYPFTLALYDLSQSPVLSNTLHTMGQALVADLPTTKPWLAVAISNTERFESDYNGVIDASDSYVDLQSFLLHLEQQSGLTPDINAAIQAVQGALTAFVVDHRLHSGHPWLYPNQEWRWSEAKGLSIYLPLLVDEPNKRALYTAGNLQWAQATAWDDLLNAYWQTNNTQAAAQTSPVDLTICASTRTCDVKPPTPLPLLSMIYLPVIQK